MSENRRSAPRQGVVLVARSGDWGEVEWVHVLECGHVDRRKRMTPVGGVIGCVKCVLADRFEKQLVTDVGPVDVDGVDGVDGVAVEVASVEAEVARIKAGVASKLSTSVDAVDVVWALDSLQYVVVMLTAAEVNSLLQ